MSIEKGCRDAAALKFTLSSYGRFISDETDINPAPGLHSELNVSGGSSSDQFLITQKSSCASTTPVV